MGSGPNGRRSVARASRRHRRGRWRRAAPTWGEAKSGDLAADQLAHLNALERDLERACARYERAIQALDERSAELERQPAVDELVARAMQETDESKGSALRVDGQLRLTNATFEDLRSLGLSVTQAKRVLALRGSGALGSTADLDSVPGLPARQLTKLRRALRD